MGEEFTEKIVKLAELTSRRYTYLKPATRTTLLSILAKSLTCSALNIQQGFYSQPTNLLLVNPLLFQR